MPFMGSSNLVQRPTCALAYTCEGARTGTCVRARARVRPCACGLTGWTVGRIQQRCGFPASNLASNLVQPVAVVGTDDDPIDRLRDDFRTVVAERKACGHWTDADEVDVGRLIKAAIDGRDQDAGLLECWARWLSGEAEVIRRWQAHVRDVEARMRAQAAAERQARERLAA